MSLKAIRAFNTVMAAQRNLERLTRRTYEVQIKHSGLGKSRRIRGTDQAYVEQQAREQLLRWNDQWARKVDADVRRSQRNMVLLEKERQQKRIRAEKEESLKEEEILLQERHAYVSAQQNMVAELTETAKALLHGANQILISTLSVDDTLDWDSMMPADVCPYEKPERQIVEPPALLEVRRKPERNDPIYSEEWLKTQNQIGEGPTLPVKKHVSKIGVLLGRDKEAEANYLEAVRNYGQKLRSYTEAVKRYADQLYFADLDAWLKEDSFNKEQSAAYETRREEAEKHNSEAFANWEKRMSEWQKSRAQLVEVLKERRNRYFGKEAQAIEDYYDLVFNNSHYPDWVPREWEIMFVSDEEKLIVNGRLPTLDEIPSTVCFTFNEKKDEIVEEKLGKKEHTELCDKVAYTMALRTMHEIFEADQVDAVRRVRFNGYIQRLNAATGHHENIFVLSACTEKEYFSKLNLAAVEPGQCFINLSDATQEKPSQVKPIKLIEPIESSSGHIISSS